MIRDPEDVVAVLCQLMGAIAHGFALHQTAGASDCFCPKTRDPFPYANAYRNQGGTLRFVLWAIVEGLTREGRSWPREVNFAEVLAVVQDAAEW